jgi:hypothetical protein
MWRYPREAETRPGIQRGRDGMSLSSIRGLLLVTRRAPHGTGVLHERNAFMMRAAELMATLGRYRRMVKEMRLTIATIPRATMAQPSENVTIEDIARLFAADGVTIPQIVDAYEWGCSMLLNLVSGVDASRRTEAMLALANAQQGTSQDEQDRPQPLEPMIGSPHCLNSEFAFYTHSKHYLNITTQFQILFCIFGAHSTSSQLIRTSEAYFGNFGPILDLRSLFRKLRTSSTCIPTFGPPIWTTSMIYDLVSSSPLFIFSHIYVLNVL